MLKSSKAQQWKIELELLRARPMCLRDAMKRSKQGNNKKKEEFESNSSEFKVAFRTASPEDAFRVTSLLEWLHLQYPRPAKRVDVPSNRPLLRSLPASSLVNSEWNNGGCDPINNAQYYSRV